MDDQLLLSDNTDDDQAQGDGSSSSIISDDENSHPLTSSLTSFLSNEDIDKCLYVTNINWRRKFSVSLSLKYMFSMSISAHVCMNSRKLLLLLVNHNIF